MVIKKTRIGEQERGFVIRKIVKCEVIKMKKKNENEARKKTKPTKPTIFFLSLPFYLLPFSSSQQHKNHAHLPLPSLTMLLASGVEKRRRRRR